jgi:hypothetical protein
VADKPVPSVRQDRWGVSAADSSLSFRFSPGSRQPSHVNTDLVPKVQKAGKILCSSVPAHFSHFVTIRLSISPLACVLPRTRLHRLSRWERDVKSV